MSERNCISMSGAGKVELPNSGVILVGTSDHTIAFLLKISALGTVQNIFCQYDLVSDSGIEITVSAAGAMSYRYSEDGSSITGIVSGLEIDEWVFVVISVTMQELSGGKIYINNVLEDTFDTVLANLGTFTPQYTRIGKASSLSINGLLDNFAVMKGTAADADDVDDWYSNGYGVKWSESNVPNGWYTNFPDGTGSVVSGSVVTAGTATDANGSMNSDVEWRAGGVGALDPFSQVLNAIWDIFESNAELASLVKPGNRIKVGRGRRIPYKSQTSDADLPEIVIEPAGCVLQPYASSSSARAEQVYEVRFTGRDLSVNETFFPVKWALFKILCTEKYNFGLSCVKRVEIGDGQDEIQNERNHYSWAAVIPITVEMFWNRSEM